MIKRRNTRQIKVGNVRIGGDAPISIQSMTKVETSNIKDTVSQIRKLEGVGCEIVRVAVKNFKDADAIRDIKRKIKTPLVCDIHFNYRLALKAIKNGADKIRLNPGNIHKKEEITEVVKAAREAGIPIRIGVNSGSVFKMGTGIGERKKENLSSTLVDAAMKYIKLFEDMKFRDIIVSLKTSDCLSTVEAYRKIANLCDYPLHLGLTASGPHDEGIVKSATGIGSLLLDGIGDTIRVSLTADPVSEVIAGKRILSSLGIRNFGPSIISCPTCGRCQIDLVKVVNEIEEEVSRYQNIKASKPLRIAIMGCEVNGPGEAMEADIGIAAGKSSGILFVKGKIIRRVKEKDFVKELVRELKNL